MKVTATATTTAKVTWSAAPTIASGAPSGMEKFTRTTAVLIPTQKSVVMILNAASWETLLGVASKTAAVTIAASTCKI